MRPSRPTDILVADDDSVMRDLLRDLLTQAGYRVRLAMTGHDALLHCTSHGVSYPPASLALLDMNMPDGDGLATCRSLRRLPGWSRIPIVMVTAQGTDHAVRDAIDAGIDGFVVKPFSNRDLLQRVSHWTGGSGGRTPHPIGGRHGAAAREPGGTRSMPGVDWSVGSHSMPVHERAQAADISHLLAPDRGPSSA